MPIRRVEVGVMTFIDDKGVTQYALAGQQVRVHSRDVDRFDRLNVTVDAAPSVEAEEDSLSGDSDDGPG